MRDVMPSLLATLEHKPGGERNSSDRSLRWLLFLETCQLLWCAPILRARKYNFNARDRAIASVPDTAVRYVDLAAAPAND
jgi:hypothetical protein